VRCHPASVYPHRIAASSLSPTRLPSLQAGEARRHFWRWNGQMVDYLVAEPAGGAADDTQTILLVHGFGAFAEHWRRNVPDLAARGHRVFACTLPGFGPSEKSPQVRAGRLQTACTSARCCIACSAVAWRVSGASSPRSICGS
jgi:pimeloyl-ACP methyl ester carboxylesterase